MKLGGRKSQWWLPCRHIFALKCNWKATGETAIFGLIWLRKLRKKNQGFYIIVGLGICWSLFLSWLLIIGHNSKLLDVNFPQEIVDLILNACPVIVKSFFAVSWKMGRLLSTLERRHWAVFSNEVHFSVLHLVLHTEYSVWILYH